MIKNIYKILVAAGLLSLVMTGCSDDMVRGGNLMHTDGNEIRLQAEIDQDNLTRANDMGFADGDRIGIYAVNYTESMNPGVLEPSGNLADNMAFEYNASENSWTGTRPLYFKDDKTPVDFYGYYPYASDITDVNAYPISIERNQSGQTNGGMSNYEASDFLWGKTSGVSPSSRLVNITLVHALAGVQVRLVEGAGFEAGEWATLDKSVMVTNTIRNARIDLATGIATPYGAYDETDIIAARHNDDFRAVVIPQTVKASTKLLDITVDGTSYEFARQSDMTYNRTKLHRFTIEVSKSGKRGDYEFTLIDESITAWESDQQSHDGLSRAYQIVEIEKWQRLEDVLKTAGINPKDVINLKIKGSLIADDFYYIRDNMRKIQALNLKEVRIIGHYEEDDYIPSSALTNAVTLRYLVLPDVLIGIGEVAFGGTNLEGSLKIPEGVKTIGAHAFTNYWPSSAGWSLIPDGGQLLAHNNLTGTLELPSSVEYIGREAFRACDFTGPLILPNSLKYLGKNAFSGCRNFTGEIHFPESLTEIEESDYSDLNDGEGVFNGTAGITGVMELPRNLKVINGFGGIDVSNVLMPEGAIEIGRYAFANAKVKSSLVIPNSVLNIGAYAFYNCNAKSITLPENLTRINEQSFIRCKNLSDTLTIPANVEVIDTEAFRECEKIEALILPSKLTYIANSAFTYCYALQYIRCDAKEPPILSEGAFGGVEKDNFTVEVPEESVDAYRNAPGWCEFKRISAYRNFVARPSKYNVLNKGGKKEIILNADAEWELIECPDWCHIDKTSGNKKTVLTLTVDRLAKGSPSRSGKVEFRLKSGSDYKTHINVGQFDYEYEEDSYVELHKATKGNGIDLFLLGDGYDAMDISSGIMMNDMKQTMEYFFAVEPYTSYKDYFNVYTGIALSEDSGVEELNKWRNTKFHTVIPKTCGERIRADWQYAMNYCAEICTPIVTKPDPKVGVILLANHDSYDGVTYSLGDSFCSLITKSTECPYPSDGRGLVQHEAGGHGIGWLADEYIYHADFIQKCGCSCCQHVDELLGHQQNGFGLNVSINGKYKEVPWTHLIFNPAYGDIVDIYEGGYFHKRGVYRSEYNSCMNNNVPYFSTWSRQLIVQRIMKLAGEQFSLADFYAKDSRALGRDFTTSRSTEGAAVARHGNPPVFIKDYKFGKKGGKR